MNQDNDLLNSDVERGMPAVTKSGGKGIMNIIVPTLLGLFAIIALIFVNGGFDDKEKPKSDYATPNKDVRNLIGSAPPPPPPPPKPPKQAPPPPMITTRVAPPPPPRMVNNGKRELTPDERKRLGGLFVLATNTGNINGNSNGNANSQQSYDIKSAYEQARMLSGQSPELEDSDQADGMEAALTATRLEGARASLLVDRNMFITKGAFLDCALETAISSDLAGMTSCRLTRDVYSTSGKVLLLEKGSKVVGEYKSGIKRGIARIFVLWSRIETPTGVIINIDSPGTGPLGRSGHDGYIDYHFWERFGSAIMLTMLDIAGDYIRNQAASNGNVSVGGGDQVENTATIALKNSINIPPTLIKHQGEHISIFVARDLDFRGVYALQTTD
ncbi:type IV secretion system protein VirB10 [sulfur-oxidizing endosymbiont of Gigantopelta aegis]|uniref:type IV secretion system protein VirB10 n=1 Tax=sulfur-oxidizing endosymbiont of Gigantopelta aegis TaxID=2794934 RepID=UPI0018DC70AB|nr:type IV secretion system protein VirB10 [sulfur-oxidizing endosymbiont of Gigantopelta aegis]